MAIDHPLVVLLAVLSALVCTWSIIRAFFVSARDDLDEMVRAPWLLLQNIYPEWTFLKLGCVVLIVAAFSVAFYKGYVYLGGMLGLFA